MNLTVRFNCLGLQFVADVDYEPYVPAKLNGPPELCHPDEGGYAEITSLTCDGCDADFLMQSDYIRERLEDAAFDACEDIKEPA